MCQDFVRARDASSGGDNAAMASSSFGALLRRYREAEGLSQEDLAERTGLAAKAIGALERGERRRPYPRTVALLADALHLDDARRHELIAAVPRSTALSFPSTSGFIGRERELAALRTRITQVSAGVGGITMLTGEAGIGKSRLARGFALSAERLGATVLVGRCLEGEWQPPYRPWVEALTDHVRTSSTASLQRDLGSAASALAQLVPQIRVRLPDLLVPAALGTDDERLRVHDAIAQVVLTIALQKTLLIVLDDLNWADRDSLGVLHHLGRVIGQARVLLLCAYRDPELGLTVEHPLLATLARLRREVEFQDLHLTGLRSEEVAMYLEETAGQSVSPALVSAIESQTGGNPLYVQEMFRHLAEQARVPAPIDPSPEVPIENWRVPRGVRQIVGERVGRLTPTTARLLKDTAGFVGGFTFTLAQDLSGLNEGELLDCLDEATESGLLSVIDGDPPRYEFAHAIVRHALYEGLGSDRRARLHRRIASALEHVYAGHEDEHAAELAAQFHASAHVSGAPRGVPYALAAAAQAAAAFAPERAAQFLRMARDLADEGNATQRAEILSRLAIAEAEDLRLDDARASADDALRAMLAAGTTARARAEFLVTMARSLKDGGASSAAWEPLVERGLELVPERDLLWARLRLLRDNYDAIRSGPIGSGRWLGQDPEAVAIARARGDETDYARTLEPLEWRTRDETNAVLARVRDWSQPRAIVRGYEVVVRDFLYRHGAFAEARVACEEMLAASERFGALSAEGEARAHTAVVQAAIGDLTLARQSLTHAEQVVGRLGAQHRLHFTTTGTAVGIAYVLDADWRGLAEAMGGFATATDAVRRPVGIVATAYAALCCARADRREAALTWIAHLTAAIQHEQATIWAHNIAVTVAAATVWELDATAHADTYSQLLQDVAQAGVGDAAVFGPLDLAMARMAALSGAVDEAQQHFERARAKLDALGHLPLRAIADYDRAILEYRSGTVTSAQLATRIEHATEVFRSLGMIGWASRASARARRLDVGWRGSTRVRSR